MNKNLQRAIAIALASSLAIANTSFAAQSTINKSETVYVIKEDNKVKEKLVSVWLNSDENINGKDKTDLKEIKDLKTDEKIEDKNGYINWNKDKKDVYYQGVTDKDTPVDVEIEYYLDGKKLNNKDLEGKSGRLKIVVTAKNNNFKNEKIEGQNKKIYAPYVVMSAMTFSDENVTNIVAKDSKVIKDGKNQIVTTILTPGLKDNFKDILEEKQMEEFKDSAEMEMDIKDYKPVESYAVISNELFQEDVKMHSIGKLRDGLQQLEDNSAKLVDASKKLTDATDKLSRGINELSSGATKLKSGSKELYDKTGVLENKLGDALNQVKYLPGVINKMADGSNTLASGINKYTAGVSKLNENSSKLVGGATQLKEGSEKLDEGLGKLKTATGQLREGSEKLGNLEGEKDSVVAKVSELQNGISSISNGAKSLNGGLNEAVNSSEKLYAGSNELNNGIQELNSKVSNLSIPDMSGLKNINVSDDLGNILSNASTIGGNIQGIKNSIGTLSQLAATLEANGQGEEAAQIYAVINSLGEASQNIGANAQNIGASTQNVGNQLSVLKGMEENIGALAGLGELKEATAKLAEGSTNLNNGLSQLPQGLHKLEEGSARLSSGADELNISINQGIEKLQGEVDPAKLLNLSDSLTKLDEATGSLKESSTKLAAGTAENVKGVETFTNAIKELDKNSEALNKGAGELSGGINQFKEKSQMLGDLTKVNSQGLTPLRNGIKQLDDGIGALSTGATKLEDGSKLLNTNMNLFSEKLMEFKDKGIDEIDRKTDKLPQFKEVLDKMSEMAKEDSSFTGTSEGFDSKYRVIEKIK